MTEIPLRVIASPAFRFEAHNPYNALLYRALIATGVVVEESSLSALTRSRANIWHVHWPEAEIGEGPLISRIRSALMFLIMILIARFKNIKIIWTVHNLEPHNRRLDPLQNLIFRFFLKSLNGSIHLTYAAREKAFRHFPWLEQFPNFVIPHGDYASAYPAEIGRQQARRILSIPPDHKALLFIGKISQYKNVPWLIKTFNGLMDECTHLIIVGQSSDESLQDEIYRLTDANPRIHLEMGLIPSERIQIYMQAADLVVLPYKAILNSGSVLLALTFQRPVLVPHTGSMIELQDAFGKQWVITFQPPMDVLELTKALESAFTMGTAQYEALKHVFLRISWDRIADETAKAYRAALTVRD